MEERDMLGYWFEDGTKCTEEVLARAEFVIGKAKMQYASRGVVQFADGTCHIFGVRHNKDEHGNLHVVQREAFTDNDDFETVVAGLRAFEDQWITEDLPVYRRDLSINPLPADK
jgi:hypothetical protein